MKTLKNLREDFRAFNLDTEEELDLDSLADIDLEALLGDGFLDADDSGVDELDFSDLEDTILGGEDEPEFSPFAGIEDDDENYALGVDDPEGDLDFNPEDTGLSDDPEFDVASIEGEEEEEQQDFDDMSQNQADDIALDDPDALEENPDLQGKIRTVRGANLVFKRRADDGNFEELWIYNVGNDIKRETQIRRAVLAGTDIDPSAQESKDGSQRAETTTTGNVQFLHITGLPQ